ncbi:MAG: tRNA epoxyqueuosine(34) reductase QueG, partial [Candidatus Acidiferrales bacterium]
MVSTDWVIAQGRAAGFDKVGIAPAAGLPELARFPEWLARGHAGEMDYLSDPRRRDSRAVMPGARSVICCALGYDTAHPRSTEVPRDPERGWLSRYAWGDDYHEIVREKLEALRATLAERAGPGFDSRAYVDTGPVLERAFASHAGLGWQGKNTCLLDAELGSFFFIGVLITNLDLASDPPLPDGCGSCTLCIEACPTGAIVEPYLLDARRCISYLTIELRSAIPEELRGPMGRHVFGCDICQDVCPYNQRGWVSEAAGFQPRNVETNNENRKEKLENGKGAGHESLFHP